MRLWISDILRSLRMRLMLTFLAGMVLTAGLFVFILAMVFYWQFDLVTYNGMKHNAASVAARMQFDAQGKPQEIKLPKDVRWLYDQLPGDVEFRVVDRFGAPVMMPSKTPQSPVQRLLPASHVPLRFDAALQLQIGERSIEVVTVPILQSHGAYYLQVAASDRALQFVGLSLTHPVPNYIFGIILISMPVVGGLMLVALFRLLRPLRVLSAEAARIDPRNLSARLSTKTVPSELSPLIDSFNLALARLEQGFREQQEFLGAAAHELKTPLALMRGQIEVEGIADRATLLADIDVMTRQVQQLLHLAEASELRNYRIEPINVRHMLADAAAFLLRMAERRQVHIHFSHSFELTESPLWVGDQGAMFTLFKNLIENAVQHSPEHSMVELKIEDGNAVSVRDYGCGIAAEDIPRVFERFWRGPGRADGQPVGAGLGMSICKEIAAAHGWRIEIEDAKPGTIFRVVRQSV
ncbi:sensor histidine kinase [Duganella guangzhouensis]|nr:ATP-binding protein [Duganella guangzhouensis]